jgi:hypothetical protein
VKKISFSLSEIDRAIKELNEYKAWVQAKSKELAKRVGEAIAKEAQAGFDASVVDVRLDGSARRAGVHVSVKNDGNLTLVIASGDDVAFVEFGAGVKMNTPVGSSPHPKGAELGYTIGSYGKGMGAREIWGYYAEGADKGLVLTRGTESTKPLYNALVKVAPQVGKIAKEVFSK